MCVSLPFFHGVRPAAGPRPTFTDGVFFRNAGTASAGDRATWGLTILSGSGLRVGLIVCAWRRLKMIGHAAPSEPYARI
jgi:hypothetical protein